MNSRDKIVWVVDDDNSISWVLEKALSRQNFTVKLFSSAESALAAIDDEGQARPAVLLSDLKMEGMGGFNLIERLGQKLPDLPVIVMTAFGDLDSAVDAYKYGVFEYLTKPFDINEMIALVLRASEQGVEQAAQEQTVSEKRLIIGDSGPIQEVFRIIGRLASSEMNILIRGESGTGKELVAEAIYRNSPRSDQPLVAINTAAIPAELLESELFGHEKGAFTGAHGRHIGRFEQANGGTLLLDEIGDMPAGLQTRLLRVLSEGRFFRVGGREEIKVSVRIIAATNQDLQSLVASGQFRNDLFHRLNVISIDTPSLRERSGDIPLLAEHFLGKAATAGVDKKNFTPSAITALRQYTWPGNVRELENLVTRLSVLSPSNSITLTDLPESIKTWKQNEATREWEVSLGQAVNERIQSGERGLMQKMGSKFERVLIRAAMEHTLGHKQNAAALLGWGRNTLTRKLKHLIDS